MELITPNRGWWTALFKTLCLILPLQVDPIASWDIQSSTWGYPSHSSSQTFLGIATKADAVTPSLFIFSYPLLSLPFSSKPVNLNKPHQITQSVTLPIDFSIIWPLETSGFEYVLCLFLEDVLFIAYAHFIYQPIRGLLSLLVDWVDSKESFLRLSSPWALAVCAGMKIMGSFLYSPTWKSSKLSQIRL